MREYVIGCSCGAEFAHAKYAVAVARAERHADTANELPATGDRIVGGADWDQAADVLQRAAPEQRREFERIINGEQPHQLSARPVRLTWPDGGAESTARERRRGGGA